MIKTSLKLTAVAAMLAGASVGANAATQDVGIVKNDVPTSFNALVSGAAPTNLNEVILFTAETDAIQAGISVMNFPITFTGGNFDLDLATVTLSSVGADGAVGGGDDSILKAAMFSDVGQSDQLISFSYDASSQNLIAGQGYYLAIAGITTGSAGGALNGSIEVTPVPEPETYAMLLAGLGLMGAVVRRRSNRKTS